MSRWTEDTNIGAGRGAFPETSASALLAAQSSDPLSRARGFTKLVEAYWKPVYKCVRIRFQKSNEDAKDLTQDFFAYALEREMFTSYDADRARFRVFMRSCVKNFVLNAETAKSRIKRGGAATSLSLDFEGAELELTETLSGSETSFEEAFDRDVVMSLESLAVEELRGHLHQKKKELYFELFEKYDRVDVEQRPTYAELAEEFGIKVTDVTNHLAYVRRTMRGIVLNKLREITANDEEFRDEAREILGIEVDVAE